MFLATRRKTSRSRVENQQTQSTYYAGSGNRTRDTLVEGECSHHCANPAPILHVHCKWQDKNDNGINLNWFRHSCHQIAKLTSYAIKDRDLSQADRLYSVYFVTHMWNLKSKKQSSWKCQSVNYPIIIVINSSFYCCC